VESLTRLFHDNLNLNEAHSYFICGPGSMIENVKDFLEDTNISKNKIKFELFSSSLKEKDIKNKSEDINLMSSVTVCIDGDDFDFELSSDGASILESALEAGADVPYSCKGGVCSVCKAKVMEGSATMDINYSLTDEDVEDGFILTCRAHPTSEKLLVDYDEM
jgi:ring-1,2-phenylacetyl-CoA epoxidase subunit PaaE